MLYNNTLYACLLLFSCSTASACVASCPTKTEASMRSPNETSALQARIQELEKDIQELQMVMENAIKETKKQLDQDPLGMKTIACVKGLLLVMTTIRDMRFELVRLQTQ